MEAGILRMHPDLPAPADPFDALANFHISKRRQVAPSPRLLWLALANHKAER